MKLEKMTLKDLPSYEGENGEYKTARPMKHAVTLEILREWAKAKIRDRQEHMHCRIMCGRDGCFCNDAVISFLVMDFNLEGKV